MGVDHVVHVLPVGGHRAGGAQLTMELDTLLAENVAGDPNFPPMPGLDHHVGVAAGLRQPAVVLVPAVALLPVTVILQEDHDVPRREDYISVVKVLGDSMSRHNLTLNYLNLLKLLLCLFNTC